MKVSFVDKKRIRKSFGKIKNVTKLPNLIEVQKRSFDSFSSTWLRSFKKI